MLKYINTQVVFREFPDETTLSFNISNCPIHCKDCHSKYLWEDVGIELSMPNILKELELYKSGITCIGLMGGDSSPQDINKIAKDIKENLKDVKIGWYSGKDSISLYIDLINFNYIKLGPYIEEYGGLDNPNTNQKLFEVNDGKLINITHKLWKNS